MVNKILITEMDSTPEQISFADHADDFSPTALNNLQFSIIYYDTYRIDVLWRD